MLTNPALLLILGALPVPLLRARLGGAWMLALPIAAVVLLWSLPDGTTGGFDMLGLTLQPVRVDSLARVFATAFCVAALLGLIYALHTRDRCSRQRSWSTPAPRSAVPSPGTW